MGTPGESQSMNRYPYAWDNPIGLYDLMAREVCAGLGPIQGCADSGGISVDVEPCLQIGAVSGCVGSGGPKICVGPMVIPIGACEDPATAAKYGETCATNGAFGPAVGAIVGKNLAAMVGGGSRNCATALIEKAVRRSGNEDLADVIEGAGIAWDVADILCSVSRKC